MSAGLALLAWSGELGWLLGQAKEPFEAPNLLAQRRGRKGLLTALTVSILVTKPASRADAQVRGKSSEARRVEEQVRGSGERETRS